MWFYLSLLLLPSAGAAISHQFPRLRPAAYLTVGAILILIVGLRYHVGCDWNLYLLMSLRAGSSTLGEAITLNDPGYMFVNWAVAQTGLGIAAVNLVCAALLVSALMLFCRTVSKPWLALFIAMPVLILLGGFSATRQSVAIAFVLFALCAHHGGRSLWVSVGLVLAGATFHESALALLPVLLLMRWRHPKRPFATLALFAAAGCCVMLLLLALPWTAHILGRHPPSGGAWIRAVPIVLALTAFAVIWRRPDFSNAERTTLFWFAAFALGCVVCGIASPFLMDRLGFYTVPFQMTALTRLIDRPRPAPAALALDAAVASPFVLLFIGWLMLGTTATCSIPYRTFLSDPSKLLLDNTRTAFKFNHITDPWGVLRPLAAEAIQRANAKDAANVQKGMIIE